MTQFDRPAGRSFVMSAGGYDHGHLNFSRQQSLKQRESEWENRVRPMWSWSTIIMVTLSGLAALAAALGFIAHVIAGMPQ